MRRGTCAPGSPWAQASRLAARGIAAGVAALAAACHAPAPGSAGSTSGPMAGPAAGPIAGHIAGHIAEHIAAPIGAPAAGPVAGPHAEPTARSWASPALVAAAPEPRRSGYLDMSPATQAMQRDDAANPAWLWVEQGRELFEARCSRCHAVAAMVGVAARHPAWDEASRRPLTLGQRIADCHARRVAPQEGTARPASEAGIARRPQDLPPAQGAPERAPPGRTPAGQPPRWAPEDESRLALEAFVALQSRGRPIAPPADARLDAWRTRGEALFRQRMGQLDLACAHCHDRHAGRRLAGSVIPQGHPTGYPIYRLEWQGLGSLQRRLRGCLTGVRAEPFAPDDDNATALEAYLMTRAAGLPMETPAVRP